MWNSVYDWERRGDFEISQNFVESFPFSRIKKSQILSSQRPKASQRQGKTKTTNPIWGSVLILKWWSKVNWNWMWTIGWQNTQYKEYSVEGFLVERLNWRILSINIRGKFPWVNIPLTKYFQDRTTFFYRS